MITDKNKKQPEGFFGPARLELRMTECAMRACG